MNRFIHAVTLALLLSSSYAYANDFLTREPDGLFECFDKVNPFGHFTGLLHDPEYGNEATITVDDESMPVVQKIEIRAVSHGTFDSEYLIVANMKRDSACVSYNGPGLTLPVVEKCDPDYFRTRGRFEFHIQPIMTLKGPIAEREADQGETLAAYRYSAPSEDWKSDGLQTCVFNAKNMQKLIRK